MTKLAMFRSRLRRRVLTKCADDYSKILNSYADSQRGFMRPIVQSAVRDNLQRTNGMPKQPSAVAAVNAAKNTTTPTPTYGKIDYSSMKPHKSKEPGIVTALDYATRWPEYAKSVWGRITKNRSNGSVRPIVGSTTAAK